MNLSADPAFVAATAAGHEDRLAALERDLSLKRDLSAANARVEELERQVAVLQAVEDENDQIVSDLLVRLDVSEAKALSARRDALEEAASTATSFLMGDPFAGVPLRSPSPHEIAAAIRTLASTVPGGEETRRTLTRAPERPELERLLREAANRPMTPAEMREQRKSWVRGQLGLAHPEWDADDLRRRVDAADEAVYGPHEMKEEPS